MYKKVIKISDDDKEIVQFFLDNEKNKIISKYVRSISVDLGINFYNYDPNSLNLLNFDKDFFCNLIKRSKSTNTVLSTYVLVCYCNSMRKWAEGVIENSVSGNQAYYAYCMAKYLNSSRKWAEKVIENSKIGDPSGAAYLMVQDCGSSREWAEQVIGGNKAGNNYLAAWNMVSSCGSSKEWYKKVTGKDYV